MSRIKATPYARKIAKQYHIDLAAVTPTGRNGEIRERDVLAARESHKEQREMKVTPLAQRIADSMKLDLGNIRGTGPGGKIGKADVLAAAGRDDYKLKPGELRQTMPPMRKAISAQLGAAASVPTVTVTTKVDVTALTEQRLLYNAEYGIHITINDLVMRAAARALTKHRRMLCSAAGDSIIYKTDINIGMAVSADDGLLVPVLREVDQLGIRALSEKARELTRRARERKLSLAECEDATFTVTNLGMYGVEAFTPVLQLPCAAIMGVCAIYDGVAVKDGAVEVRKLLHICTTFDHRVLDGADAAAFNLSVREFLEHPESLLEE